MNEMKIEGRDFEKDLKSSQDPLILKEWEIIFKKIWGEDIIIKFQDNKIAQLEFGTDAIVQQKTGRKFSVEYKTKRYALKKFNQWPLEIKHHLYLDEDRRYQIKSKEGWLYRSTADYIVFGTLNEEKNKIIEACAITLSPFKDEDFKKNISKLDARFSYTNDPFVQTTIFKLASTDWLKEHANKFFYFKNGSS